MKKTLIAGTSLFALLLAACSADTTPTAEATPDADVPSYESPAETADAAARLGTFGIELANMDTSVDPGDDFFRYVNGTWLEETEIPADRSRYSSFNVLSDQAEKRVRAIIEQSAAKENPTADEKRIGDLYAAYTNVDAIEARGLAPAMADIERMRGAETKAELARIMADPALGVGVPMGGFVGVDAKANENYIAYISQGGLGLPNRDYYFDDSEKGQEILSGYRNFLAAMLTEAGLDNVEERAADIVALETALAENYYTRVENRDRERTYNKVTRDELIEMTDGFPTADVLEVRGLDGQEAFVVRQPEAMRGIGEVFAATGIDTLRDYATARLLSNNSAVLPARIDEARFEFYGKQLRGQQEQRPRWKRGVQSVNGSLGELVGKVYVTEHFPESSKAQMDELVENLRDAFREGIDGLDWMGDETKEQAQYKLAKFNPKIGYPVEFETYDGLEIDRDDLYASTKSARLWGFRDNVSQLGQPIDREAWGMTPQTVNAYYNSTLNEIVFPAAILDAPFFDPNADPAVNYGGIGAVIGHEMGHGFDDQGRKSDGDGVQRDWWTEADAEAYEDRAGALAAQYDQFEPLPGENINGRLSLGENIGDLTGVNMAYQAYKKSLNGEEAPVIDGLTGDQRFFMAWAQVWASKFREEAMRAQLKNGPHSPGEFRTNGIVRNVDAWYDAFDVQPDDALYLPPEERVRIW